MSGATLAAVFTDASGASVSKSLSSYASLGSHILTLTGLTVGLVDGKRYSIQVSGRDPSGNSGASNTVTNVAFDLSAPTVPVLSAPTANAYVSASPPTLSWVGSTDNVSPQSALSYEIQISSKLDFSAIIDF